MFSLKDMLDCSGKLKEEAHESCANEVYKEQAKVEAILDVRCHQTPPLPMELGLSTDAPGAIALNDTRSSGIEDVHREGVDHFDENEGIAFQDQNTPASYFTWNTLLPPYSMCGQDVGIENSGAQPFHQPMSAFNDGWSSQEPQPYQLQSLNPPNSCIGVDNYSCPVSCPCTCHAATEDISSKSVVVDKEKQRPCVIMVPVGREIDAPSLVSHMPLQLDDDSHSDDSDIEEECFQQAMDGKLAWFKLSKEDWKKIPINSFPSGGRLLGGEWTRVFGSKLRSCNPWCDVRFKNNHVRSANSRKMHSAPFFRGAGECKRRECGLKMAFVIRKECGSRVDVRFAGNICHKSKKT